MIHENFKILLFCSEEFDSSKSFGIYLIPNKKTTYRFQPGDSLITLAEDES